MCVSEQSHRRGGRPAKTAEDYRKLARSCGFYWSEDGLPADVMKPTRWICMRNREHVRYDCYSDFAGRVTRCLVCAGKRKKRGKVTVKTAADYAKLAESLGFLWLGELPANVNKPTSWKCRLNSAHIRNDCYSDFERHVKRCLVCAGLRPGCGPLIKTADDYRRLAGERGFFWKGELPATTRTRTHWVCRVNPEHVREDSYDVFVRQVARCLACAGARRLRRSKAGGNLIT